MVKTKSTYILLILHSIVWLGFIFINYFISHQFYQRDVLFGRIFLILGLNLVVYLFCYYILVPRFVQLKKYFLVILFGLLTFLISYQVRIYIEEYYEPYLQLKKASITFDAIKTLMFIPQGLMVLLASLLSVLKLNFKQDEELFQLKIEEAKRELELIKAKINPHFLLNTLNNIYAINYEESPKTSESIMQLSTILSYVIYKSKSKLISLQEEVELMKALIGLYQLKNDNSLQITFDDDHLAENNWQVPTQVLFSLLENAFKHSNISVLQTASFIRIRLHSKQNNLHLEIENSVQDDPLKQAEATNYSGGLGINAIQRILAEHYEKYTFQANRKANSYHVNLVINGL